MAIFIDENTQVLVQGITGKQGKFHTKQMLAYGTKITAGVSPGKSGLTMEGIPVYNTINEAICNHNIDATIVFVPPISAKDAIFEAIAANIKIVVCITEHIPLHDVAEIMAYAKSQGTVIIGPNTFGVISSGKSKIGIMPNQFFIPGNVGIVARSGTLSYEIVGCLANSNLGTSTVLGLGGDKVVGLNFIDVLTKFEKDPATDFIVLIGEIGGTGEEEAAHFIKANISKPIIAYLAGKSAPPGKRMGHAGAIIEGDKGTYESKVDALENAGVFVADLPFQVPHIIHNINRYRRFA